jgi:hypothetical protein
MLLQGLIEDASMQHWGFNLEASIRGAPHLNIRDHYATVNAKHIVTVDTLLLPDGTLTPTTGTGHSHQGKKIGDQFVEGGYGQSPSAS